MTDNVSNSEFHDELRTAFRAAEEAGAIIDRYAKEGFETEFKEDGSKITEADRKSQEKIVEVISEEFPDDGFLGEEEHLTPDSEERVWIIDPIDGTFNFDKRFNHFCISIALEVGGNPVVAVVYSPESSLERSYFALRGGGAYATDSGIEESEKISVSNQSSIEGAVYFLTTFDIYEGELESELDVLEELASQGGVHRQLGACALELCRVAEGSADFLVNPISKKVDFAAARLILEEAGGSFRRRESRFPNEPNEIVASNGVIQGKVEDIVSDSFV